MKPVDADRTRILLRRAAFVSSTLAALGCTPSKTAESAEGPGSSQVSIPTNPDDETSSSPVPASGDAGASQKPGDMPSLEMPSGVGEEARENFQRLFDNMKRIHPILDEMEKIVSSACSVLDSKCEDTWRKLAAKQNELKEIQTFMHTCPGSSDDAKLYAEREKDHYTYFGERQSRLAQRIEKALEPDSQKGLERWEKLQEEAYSAAPYPCLSFACKEW